MAKEDRTKCIYFYDTNQRRKATLDDKSKKQETKQNINFHEINQNREAISRVSCIIPHVRFENNQKYSTTHLKLDGTEIHAKVNGLASLV